VLLKFCSSVLYDMFGYNEVILRSSLITPHGYKIGVSCSERSHGIVIAEALNAHLLFCFLVEHISSHANTHNFFFHIVLRNNPHLTETRVSKVYFLNKRKRFDPVHQSHSAPALDIYHICVPLISRFPIWYAYYKTNRDPINHNTS